MSNLGKKINRKKILVAVDRSKQSLEAVRYTARMFSPDKVLINLFMVMNKMPEAYWDVARSNYNDHYGDAIPFVELLRERERDAEEFMAQARQIVLDAGVPSEAVSTNIQDKKLGIARDILAEAERNQYRAVVAGRTGRSKVKDFMLGSVAHKIVEQIGDIPIWTIGGTPDPNKILVAIDASKAAHRIIDYVGEMFAGSDIEITFFHATRELGIYSDQKEKRIDNRHEEKWQQLIEEKIRFIFDESIVRLAQAGVNRDNISIKFEQKVISRAAAIIKEARDGKYGTVVAGRKGLTRVNRFMMGRVTYKLIQHAGDMAVCIVN